MYIRVDGSFGCNLCISSFVMDALLAWLVWMFGRMLVVSWSSNENHRSCSRSRAGPSDTESSLSTLCSQSFAQTPAYRK